MINVYYYQSGNYINIHIVESLQITSPFDQEAILEVISHNELFDPEAYGSISHMKSQWQAHNLAYELSTGNRFEKWFITRFDPRPVEDIAESASELDLRPADNMTRSQKVLYSLIELML